MDRFVHNGDIVYAKNGQYKVIAAYGEDGNPGCLLRDSVHVFIPNVVITDQEATMIMEKSLLQRSDLDLKQWLSGDLKISAGILQNNMILLVTKTSIVTIMMLMDLLKINIFMNHLSLKNDLKNRQKTGTLNRIDKY